MDSTMFKWNGLVGKIKIEITRIGRSSKGNDDVIITLTNSSSILCNNIDAF